MFYLQAYRRYMHVHKCISLLVIILLIKYIILSRDSENRVFKKKFLQYKLTIFVKIPTKKNSQLNSIQREKEENLQQNRNFPPNEKYSNFRKRKILFPVEKLKTKLWEKNRFLINIWDQNFFLSQIRINHCARLLCDKKR